MKIKSVHLKNYKRFTDLEIDGIPETARLVVLVGPNGTGKSSVFDSFLLAAHAIVNPYGGDGHEYKYYDKFHANSKFFSDVKKRVKIEFHNPRVGKDDLKFAFHVRSAYRNESDLNIEQIRATQPDDRGPHIARIIDFDSSVLRNYERMAWKGLQDLYQDAADDVEIGEYRKSYLGDLQEAIRGLFTNPELVLQDFGGIQAGAFRFSKGGVSDFHYRNLSGGEKAAFDILLDVFVKRDVAVDSVFCIDEPELHVATNLQGPLIASVLKLLPNSTQLWIATHSIGIVKEAYRMHQERSDEVTFLDFSDHDFETDVVIKPSTPNRAFWQNTYKVALDDLSSLVAPQRVFICEGSKNKNVNAFDAQCYNKLFMDESPETLFISRGGSGEVIRSDQLIAILEAIAHGIEVKKLIDRDEMSHGEREKMIEKGTRVLLRREVEDYLYDEAVLKTFLKDSGCKKTKINQVLMERSNLLSNQLGPVNIKDVTQELFTIIRTATGLTYLGKKKESFALEYLVPALRKTPNVYEELRKDVFGT